MASYYSSDFEDLFLSKISESETHDFVICTGYTRHSYIERFYDSLIDPDSNFSNKIRRLLIGDPLGHSIEERKKIDRKLGGKVLFCDKFKFNKAKRAFNPIVHSKIIIGYDENRIPIWAMVGSNNFTNNGMREKNEESMLLVEDKTLLKEIDLHFDKICKLCDRLSSLKLDRVTGVKIDGGWGIILTSPSNQAIDPILIIEVLIEDDDELELARNANSVLLDCIKSSELTDILIDGRYRPFLLIFVDDVKLQKREKILVRYGYSSASIATDRGAEYAGSSDAFVRYYGDVIADLEEERIIDSSTRTTQGIPFKNLATESDFVATKSQYKKRKMANIINRFLSVSNLNQLDAAYSLVSVERNKGKERKVTKVELENIGDKQVVPIGNFAEILKGKHFQSLKGKMGYLGEGNLGGKDAHEKEEFYLKANRIEELTVGYEEMKKHYSGDYSTIVKSALDIDSES